MNYEALLFISGVTVIVMSLLLAASMVTMLAYLVVTTIPWSVTLLFLLFVGISAAIATVSYFAWGKTYFDM